MAFRITQGDTAPALVSTLTDNGTPVDITGYTEVSFHVEDRYKEIHINDDTTGSVNVIDDSAGVVEYVFDSSDTNSAGIYYGEWEVEYGNGSIETFPTGDKIEIIIGEQIA